VRITSVEFVTSAGSERECPDGPLAEIGVSGRSNVGKSSLLNSLLARRDLANVSKTPGRTQRLNYFLVNQAFHLVDLPGYGYADAPASARDRWSAMMQGYLRRRRQLVGLVQLVDARHLPSKDDHEMVQWLRDEQMPFCLVPTKMDKLGPNAGQQSVRRIVADLDLPPTQPVVPWSSTAALGRSALLAWIGQTLEATAAGG
jgi:GTP-binding protein